MVAPSARLWLLTGQVPYWVVIEYLIEGTTCCKESSLNENFTPYSKILYIHQLCCLLVLLLNNIMHLCPMIANVLQFNACLHVLGMFEIFPGYSCYSRLANTSNQCIHHSDSRYNCIEKYELSAS